MKAVRWHAQHDVRVEQIEAPPPPSDDEVQIEVLACGICGTDVEEYRSGPLFVAAEPHPLTGRSAPLTLGHEFAGRVVRAGRAVRTPQVGDLVAVAPDISCGRCGWCTSGRENLCPQLGSLGLAGDGGLAELCNVGASRAVRLPDHVSPEAGALLEPLAVTLAGLRRGRARRGDRLVVVGGGAIGLLTVQAAHALGLEGVCLVEPLASRRAVGRRLGADVVTPDDAGAVEGDVVVDCSGSAGGFATSVACAGRGGRVVIVALHAHPVELDALGAVARELEVLGSLSYVMEDFVAASRFVADGSVDAGALITRRVALDRTLDDGILALMARPDDHLKIVVTPRPAAAEAVPA